MKKFIPFLIIYVLVHSSQGDSVRSYDGQSKATIQTLLAAERNKFDFITKTQYEAFVEAHKPSKSKNR